MEKGSIYLKMGQCMKGIGCWGRNRGLDAIIMLMVIVMKVILNGDLNMERVDTAIQPATSTKANSSTITSKTTV